MAEETEYKPLIEPVKFVDESKRTFVYEFKRVNTEMAEWAISVQELKELTRTKPAQSINDLLRSRSAEWVIICCSCLIREEIDGKLQPFSSNIEENASFLKALEGKEPIIQTRRVLEDFFTLHERRERVLKLLQGEPKLDALSVLLAASQTQANG